MLAVIATALGPLLPRIDFETYNHVFFSINEFSICNKKRQIRILHEPGVWNVSSNRDIIMYLHV